jgi:hypothetical protein
MVVNMAYTVCAKTWIRDESTKNTPPPLKRSVVITLTSEKEKQNSV